METETFTIPAAEVQRSALAGNLAAPGQPVPANQPQPVGDRRLADILTRQAAGEKLSAKDRGYMGSVKRKGKAKVVAAPADANELFEAPQPVPASEAPAGNELFEAEVEAETQAANFSTPAIDPNIIRKTANAMLSSIDTGTKILVGHKAEKAGGDGQTVESYKSAVALKSGNRELMVENSEPVIRGLCKIFGCPPEKLQDYMQGSAFLAGAVAHVTGVWAAIESINQSQKERQSKTT